MRRAGAARSRDGADWTYLVRMHLLTVVHVHGAPCAAILVLSCIWKDLRVCLVLESTCAGCAGLPSARYQRSGLTCLVRVYLLCCCGACLRRSLRYHTFAFIHLERFDGLSCARKSSRRLRRFALGSTSKKLVAFRSLTPSSPRQLGSQQKFPVRSRVRPSKPIPRSLTRSAVESSTTLTLFGHVATICRHQTPPTPPTLPTTPFRSPPAPPAPSLPASTSPARPEIPR